MNMKYTEISNSTWMYIWVGITITLVFAQCMIYMYKAWGRARQLGYTDKQIKRGLYTGIGVSIMPTLPVMLILITMIPLMGTPLVWLRLSTVGSAPYETQAATLGIQAVGETMTAGGYSAYAWVCAAWTMTFGAGVSILWSAFALKPIDKLYAKLEKYDMGLLLVVGSGCMAGIMGYCSNAYGFCAMDTMGVIFLFSFAVSALMGVLYKKFPEKRWLNDFNLAVSMILGMALAFVLF